MTSRDRIVNLSTRCGIIPQTARLGSFADLTKPPLPHDARLLLEQAYHELAETCLNIVLTTAVLNHLNAALDWRASDAHFRYVPPNPVLLRLVGLTDSLASRTSDLSIHADVMIFRLNLAKSLLRSLRGPSANVPLLRDRDNAIDSWCSLADSAIRVLDDLENIVADIFVEDVVTNLTANSCELRSSLIAARDGATPWIRNGNPERPEWAERRRCRRVPFTCDAELRSRGRRRAVRIRDASERGLGIEFCGQLNAAEVVILVLENGRRFVGSVAWCHSDRAGIILSKRLPAMDPILSST